MREPRPRHTLQVIRVPSLEVQDLGLTSFDSWLDENGYDKTNARNNRTIWAREGGWHLKRCRNLETGTDDFWGRLRKRNLWSLPFLQHRF